jgi:hypothetical protein
MSWVSFFLQASILSLIWNGIYFVTLPYFLLKGIESLAVDHLMREHDIGIETLKGHVGLRSGDWVGRDGDGGGSLTKCPCIFNR